MRRLEDGRVAEDESGKYLQGHLGEREVPRDQRGNNPEWLASAEAQFGDLFAGNERAELAPSLAGPVKRHMDQLLDIAMSVFEGLTVFLADQARQLILALLCELRDREEVVRTPRRWSGPPCRKCLMGSVYCGLGVHLAGARDLRKHLTSDWVVGWKCSSAFGTAPIALDVVFGMHFHPLEHHVTGVGPEGLACV